MVVNRSSKAPRLNTQVDKEISNKMNQLTKCKTNMEMETDDEWFNHPSYYTDMCDRLFRWSESYDGIKV